MSKVYYHKPTHPYFLFDPNKDMEFFDNVEERDKAAADCITEYLDGDGWGEGVDGIFVGAVTGTSKAFNVRKRPDELDEDGCDHEGINWSNTDFTELCDYRIEPVDPQHSERMEWIQRALHVGPSLEELTERLAGVPEVSGAVRQPQVDTPESKEVP
jgi:hypothetical protein